MMIPEWGDLQQKYYRCEIRDKQFNSTRWKQSIVTALIDHGTRLWKERCDILHAEKQSTEEARYRSSLKAMLCQLKTNKDSLHQSDSYLLQKTDNFFHSCKRANLEMWNIRLNAAIERQQKRKREKTRDIRQFGTIKRRTKRKQREFQDTPPPPAYMQQTLFQTQTFQTTNMTNLNVHSTPSTLLDPLPAYHQNLTPLPLPTKRFAKYHKNRRVRRRTVQQKIQSVFTRHKRKENTYNTDIMPEKPPKQDNYLPVRKRLRRAGVDPKNYR